MTPCVLKLYGSKALFILNVAVHVLKGVFMCKKCVLPGLLWALVDVVDLFCLSMRKLRYVCPSQFVLYEEVGYVWPWVPSCSHLAFCFVLYCTIFAAQIV